MPGLVLLSLPLACLAIALLAMVAFTDGAMQPGSCKQQLASSISAFAWC